MLFWLLNTLSCWEDLNLEIRSLICLVWTPNFLDAYLMENLSWMTYMNVYWFLWWYIWCSFINSVAVYGGINWACLSRQLVFTGLAMLLRQLMKPARPLCHPVKIHLDEIDNPGIYEFIFPGWCLYIFPSDVRVTPNHPWPISFIQYNGIVCTIMCSSIGALLNKIFFSTLSQTPTVDGIS